MRCISPKNIKESPSSDILDISKSLPFFSNISELDDEWRLLKLENFEPFAEKCRLDHFWRKLFDLKINGVAKYPNLRVVVQALLCLSHGNAEVERGFSLSARVLTKDRNPLHERTLNSILIVSDAIKHDYENCVNNIEITPELHKLAQTARQHYEEYLTTKKQQEEHDKQEVLEKRKKQETLEKEMKAKEIEKENVKRLERSLVDVQKKEHTKNKAATELLHEANEKLKKALKNNNIVEANIAQGLIQAAQSMLEEEANLQKEAVNLQKVVNKRKSDLLSYFTKKCKKD